MSELVYKDCVACIDVIFGRASNDGGLPLCAAITDAHGDLIAFGRMDGAPMRSIALSRDKAYTSIYMDRDTSQFREMMTEFRFELSWFANSRLTALPGGVRILYENGCVGAIGLSGRRAEEDEELARFGVDFLKETLRR